MTTADDHLCVTANSGSPSRQRHVLEALNHDLTDQSDSNQSIINDVLEQDSKSAAESDVVDMDVGDAWPLVGPGAR